MEELMELDEHVRITGSQLDVDLPNTPGYMEGVIARDTMMWWGPDGAIAGMYRAAHDALAARYRLVDAPPPAVAGAARRAACAEGWHVARWLGRRIAAASGGRDDDRVEHIRLARAVLSGLAHMWAGRDLDIRD
jgi:hypothetical protein